MSTQTKILVTGGAGFVGSHLVESLQKNSSAEIHITVYSDQPSYAHQLLPEEQIHQLDLTDQEKTFTLVKKIKPNQIYHLAALAAVGKSFTNIKHVLDNNTQLQLNLLEAVRQHALEARILIIGSAMEYDLITKYENFSPEKISETYPLGPVSPYAVSKALQDFLGQSYAHSFKLDIIRVRPFNHIGERQSPDFVVPAFAQQIAAIERGEQEKIRVGNLEAVRDFTDVKDMVEAYQLLMENGEGGQVYNIGSGQGYKIKQVLRILIEQAETEIQVETDPDKMRPADVPIAIADSSKIKKLGWSPTINLETTLTRILDYWRSHS